MDKITEIFTTTDFENPREGDLGRLPSGSLCAYRNGEWVAVLIPSPEKSDREIELMKKRKEMYDAGEVNYYSKGGIKMTIRPDGTEYIDKRDMPA